jgi:hypothetical protein
VRAQNEKLSTDIASSQKKAAFWHIKTYIFIFMGLSYV